MANLFVVFTPFQLFVAQQIIHQEQLTNNILIESYVKGNVHFLSIYDLMRIDEYWEKRIEFTDFPHWDGFRTTSFSDIKQAYANYKKIRYILEENNVKYIYLGEIQNTTIRFTDVVFSHLGYKVIFFEEGSAHYIQRPYEKETFKIKIKIFLRDILYYLPIYHVHFAKWRYIPNRPIKGLPIHKRYNILPLHKEEFDVRLYPQKIVSDKLQQYMSTSIKENDDRRILFLTDPLQELLTDKYIHLYYDTVKECFDKLNSQDTIYIKFHPRDPEQSRKKVIELAQNASLQYRILSEKINIPVEYYLQQYQFEKIYIFNASTYFYNGYIFPNCQFIKLLPILYQKAQKEKINKFNFNLLKNLMKGME